jgi:GNAT superfamily N-acetyltransferase
MASTDPAPALPPGLKLADLVPGDAEAGRALSAEIGWNQTAADWTGMIGCGPGWICRDSAGRTVATALTLPYGERFAWIAMVLVTEAWRRRGIAGALMHRAVEATLEAALIPGLDATPAGRAVYGALGFRDIYGIIRLRAENPRLDGGPDRSRVRPLRAMDLPETVAFDRIAFGADRATLLTDLRRRATDLAWIAETGDGYCLGRAGRAAWQIGPVVAPDNQTATALIRAALGPVSGPVMIDVPDRHGALVDWLCGAGFAPERPYTRMLLGRPAPLDAPERIFAIAGPVLG